MADDINAMLITGCVEDDDGETFHVDVVFSADKKALEAFLGKGQSNPWSLNSNDERFVLPWTSDARPADIHAAMPLLCGPDGLTPTYPTSHAALRNIAHVPYPNEDLPRSCVFCDRAPFATKEDYCQAVADKATMRADKSKEGKKEWDQYRSGFRSDHGDVNEFEYPPVATGTDRVIPEALHTYDLNGGKQAVKWLVLRDLSPYTLARISGYLTGMGVKLDVTVGGSLTKWFKGADFHAMMLGDSRFPGGAPAWFSQLVYCIGEWELESGAAPTAPSWHANFACRPRELLPAMITRYGKDLATRLVRMLEMFDALRNLFKVVSERPVTQVERDDVAYRHALAGPHRTSPRAVSHPRRTHTHAATPSRPRSV